MAAAIISPPATFHLRRHRAPPSNPAALNTSFSPRLPSLHRLRPPSLYCVESQPVGVDDGPVSVELEPIAGEVEFHRVVSDAAQVGCPVVVLWMAKWCRKCIYLKPKLEKLAADYYPRVRFYCVDVNSVPQALVNYAGITKMPTIQLWQDGKNQAEVIGGYQAWLVVNDVREMIDNEF